MGRSGYSDDCENLELYRSAVRRAMAGRRGQKALRDLLDALDAMPDKQLIQHSFSAACGVCSLGALAAHLGIDVSDLDEEQHDPDDPEPIDTGVVGARLDIAPSMAAEVMFMNDEASWHAESPEKRWARMREWAARHIREDSP